LRRTLISEVFPAGSMAMAENARSLGSALVSTSLAQMSVSSIEVDSAGAPVTTGSAKVASNVPSAAVFVAPR
jgi:hypothetical protein